MNLDELDQMAAEKVMGWTFRPSKVIKDYGDYIGSGSPTVTKDKWQPTRNIAQAFELWEKIRASGKYCCIELRSPISEGWEMALTKEDSDHEKPDILVGGGGTELSAASVITIACLKAKGVEV